MLDKLRVTGTMRDLPVRWGLSLPNRGVLFGLATVGDLFEAAALAEESGAFESVWVGDSFIHKPRLDSIVMLSNLAARTRRVRLGTICMATFPLRHPVELAIQWASLDHVSGGRTVLGACIGGGHEPELRAFGQTSGERVPRLEEGVALLRALWGDGKVRHRGRFYTLEDYDVQPKPVQRPCPIWIAVNPRRPMSDGTLVKRALERVVRLGDGYMTDAVAPDEFRRRWDFLQETAAQRGRDLGRFETCLHAMVNVNDHKRTAWEESKDYFRRYYTPSWPTDDVIRLWLAHGPPEECAALIREWLDMGVTTPVLRFTAHDQLAQIRRFVAEVLPLVQG